MQWFVTSSANSPLIFRTLIVSRWYKSWKTAYEHQSLGNSQPTMSDFTTAEESQETLLDRVKKIEEITAKDTQLSRAIRQEKLYLRHRTNRQEFLEQQRGKIIDARMKRERSVKKEEIWGVVDFRPGEKLRLKKLERIIVSFPNEPKHTPYRPE